MINWKLRLQNKTTLVAIVTTTISFIYFTLEVFGVVPKFDQTVVVKAVLGFIDLLAILGIVIDPTTSGVGDSERALNYLAPAPSAQFTEDVDDDDDLDADLDTDDGADDDDEDE